jgi:hypothetical protein
MRDTANKVNIAPLVKTGKSRSFDVQHQKAVSNTPNKRKSVELNSSIKSDSDSENDSKSKTLAEVRLF